MVWAFRSRYEVLTLVIIDTTPGITARRYIDEFNTLCFRSEVPTRWSFWLIFYVIFYLIIGHAQKCTFTRSWITRYFFENKDISVIEHTAKIRDLNPIEHRFPMGEWYCPLVGAGTYRFRKLIWYNPLKILPSYLFSASTIS